MRPGERYRLRVQTPEGEIVAGATTVPATPGRITSAIPRQFHRARDSMFLGWPDVAGTSRYEVRIETPSGPFSAFMDSLKYLVSGAASCIRGPPAGRGSSGPASARCSP